MELLYSITLFYTIVLMPCLRIVNSAKSLSRYNNKVISLFHLMESLFFSMDKHAGTGTGSRFRFLFWVLDSIEGKRDQNHQRHFFALNAYKKTSSHHWLMMVAHRRFLRENQFRSSALDRIVIWRRKGQKQE